MIIKHVTKNLKDVFFGEGWENWARVCLKQNRILKSTNPTNHAYNTVLISRVKQALAK